MKSDIQNSRWLLERMILCAIALALLPGCLTNYVVDSGKRSQSVELRQAAASQKRIVLSYDLERGEHGRVSRCAAWNRKVLATNQSNEAVWGELVPLSTMKTKDLKAVPLSTNLNESEELFKSHPMVMFVKDHSDPGVHLEMLSPSINGTNQTHLFLYEGKTYEAWWATPLLPFTAMIDIATSPIQFIGLAVALTWGE